MAKDTEFLEIFRKKMTPEQFKDVETQTQKALDEMRKNKGLKGSGEEEEEDTFEGEGIFTRDVGRLPPSVRKLLEEVKDEKITSVQAWRYPLMKGLQNIIKKIVKLPYDSVFHLGLNLNEKYNLEKDVLIKFTKAKERGDKPENKSRVYPVSKDITFGELFDGLRAKMGDKFTEYNARTNNCQDFSLAILSVLGVDDPDLKTFIKQDAEKIYKSFGIFEGLVETGAKLSTLKDQVVDRLTQGEGQEGGAYLSGARRYGGEDDDVVRPNLTGLMDMRKPTLSF